MRLGVVLYGKVRPLRPLRPPQFIFFQKRKTQFKKMISEICPVCDATEWYRPPEKNVWVCRNCDPPKKEISRDKKTCESTNEIVAASRRVSSTPDGADHSPTALAVFTVTCCRPWCPRCRSWQGRETLWSDGSSTIRCRCCGAVMPDWPNTKEGG